MATDTAPIAKVFEHEGPTAMDSVKDIVFGSIAGMIGKVIEFPFDTVKVRLQSQPDDRPLRYKGPIDCFRQSIRQDGIQGLYRGLSPPLVGAAAENSSLFFSYSIAQTIARKYFLPYEYTEDMQKKLPLDTLIVCGALSGSFASFVLTPIELIKCKMQVQGRAAISAASLTSGSNKPFIGQSAIHTLTIPHPPGPLTLIRDIVRVYGLKGLWHGHIGTFLRETGGSAAWFGTYEYCSKKLCEWGGKERTSSADQMISGAIAGVSYNFFLFPADSIKSKMQTEAIGVRGEPVKGFWAVGKGIYKSGGIQGFYRGCGITCLRSAPSSAIIFFCYETLKEQFHDLGR